MNREQAEQQMLVWKLAYGDLPQSTIDRLNWLHSTGIFDPNLANVSDERIVLWIQKKYPGSASDTWPPLLISEQTIIEYLTDTP